MVLPEANAGGANFPTASRLSARLVKASSEARQIERFQAHRRWRSWKLLKRYGGEPDPLARPGVRELAAFYA